MTLNIKAYIIPDPDLYFDIAELPNPFKVPIPICITNNESVPLYFRVLIVNPPEGWQVTQVDLGPVDPGESKCFTAVFSRLAPTLTDGEYDEQLTLRVEAYTDDAYTTLYGYQEVTVTIHFIDHTDPAWTILYHDNFDDGTEQGWVGAYYSVIDEFCQGGGKVYISSTHYMSPPYSLNPSNATVGHSYKEYDVGAYTKAIVILHIYAESNFAIKINEKLVKPCNIPAPQNTWLRFAYPLKVNATNVVRIACVRYTNIYIDEVIVIAK